MCQADAVSARYNAAAFPPASESEARRMLQLVQLAFLRRLPSLEWMVQEDKLAAADKLAGMVRWQQRLHRAQCGQSLPHSPLTCSLLPLRV
jgi:hypothetical protein